MTTFGLKFIALIFMLLDHIGLFFPASPVWFRWIGRLSAPLFIYCMVFGFKYTKSRRIYITRMYLFSAGMAIMDLIINFFIEGDLVTNNIFSTLFCIAVIIRLIDYKLEGGSKRRFYAFCFCIWQITGVIILYLSLDFVKKTVFVNFIMGLTGNIFCSEGGFIFVALGVLLYYVKESKKYTAIFYSLYCILYSVVTITDFVPRVITRLEYYRFTITCQIFRFIFPFLGFDTIGIHYDSIFYVDYQWMMLGALPLMLLYNGKKGKNIKYFFYLFYPIHILVLSIIKICIG